MRKNLLVYDIFMKLQHNHMIVLMKVYETLTTNAHCVSMAWRVKHLALDKDSIIVSMACLTQVCACVQDISTIYRSNLSDVPKGMDMSTK